MAALGCLHRGTIRLYPGASTSLSRLATIGFGKGVSDCGMARDGLACSLRTAKLAGSLCA